MLIIAELFYYIVILFILLCYCYIIYVMLYSLLYCFITLLHLTSSFLNTWSLLTPYAYVFIESIDCILLSSLALNAIL